MNADPVAPATGATVLFQRHAAADTSVPSERLEPAAPALSRRVSGSSSASAEPSGETDEGAQAKLPPLPTEGAAEITDAERLAVRITATDLDLHLNRETGEMTTRARLRLRNGGAAALPRIVLQISSSLWWSSVTLLRPDAAGARLPFTQHALLTDADHTGAAAELVVPLSVPLPPGESLTLDVYYAGRVGASAERLLRLGAPEAKAAAVDWDRISPEFTGLRGFGNVLWTPVAAAATVLPEGESFAAAADRQRQRSLDATMSLRLTVESAGSAPAAAFFAGVRQTLTPVTDGDSAAPGATDGDAEMPSVAAAVWPAMRLEDRLPSLFLVSTEVPAGPSLRFSGPLDDAGDDAHAPDRAADEAALKRVRTFLAEWLGETHAAAALTVLRLPAGAVQPFAEGSLLVVPESAGSDPRELAEAWVVPAVSAALPVEAPPWLRRGLPEFLSLLWLERTRGRESERAGLGAGLTLLQHWESGEGERMPLGSCAAAACARTKAVYALAMLRDALGEDALKAAIPVLLEKTTPDAAAQLETALERISGKELRWFFTDWFAADLGLPQLTIVAVAPRKVERGARGAGVDLSAAQAGSGPLPERTAGGVSNSTEPRGGPGAGSWIVAVEIQNAGAAVAEVPVMVRSGQLQNTVRVRVAGHSRATVRVPFEAPPEEVSVNDGTTPETRGTLHHTHITLPAAAH